jgi:hypothetical protein
MNDLPEAIAIQRRTKEAVELFVCCMSCFSKTASAVNTAEDSQRKKSFEKLWSFFVIALKEYTRRKYAKLNVFAEECVRKTLRKRWKTEKYGVVRYGTVRYGTLWYAMVWYGIRNTKDENRREDLDTRCGNKTLIDSTFRRVNVFLIELHRVM